MAKTIEQGLLSQKIKEKMKEGNSCLGAVIEDVWFRVSGKGIPLAVVGDDRQYTLNRQNIWEKGFSDEEDIEKIKRAVALL